MKIFNGLLAVIAIVALVGCGELPEIHENKPISMVADEAAKMSAEDLKIRVAEYQQMIAQKTAKLKEYEAQISDLSVSDLMGENAKTIKEQTKQLSTSISKLEKQLEVCAKALAVDGE